MNGRLYGAIFAQESLTVIMAIARRNDSGKLNFHSKKKFFIFPFSLENFVFLKVSF